MAKSTKPSAAEPEAGNENEGMFIYKNISGVNQHLAVGEETIVVEPHATIALKQTEFRRKYKAIFEEVGPFGGLFAEQ